jgi:hypothetical protein
MFYIFVMPTAHGKKEKKQLSKAYAICTAELGTGPKREKCVRDVFKRLKKE